MSLIVLIPAQVDLFGLATPAYEQGCFVYFLVIFVLKNVQNPIKKIDRGEHVRICFSRLYVFHLIIRPHEL